MTIPQCRQNKGGDDANRTLHSSLVLGRTDSGRENGCLIMLRQLLICLVENDLIFTMFLYTGFQNVTLDDSGDTAKVLVSIDMGSGPGFLVHGEECLHVAVTAERQCRYEYIGRDNFAGICVNDRGCISGPIYLHQFTGLVI